MKASALRKRAVASGAGEEQLMDADDADNIKAFLIDLIMWASAPDDDGSATAALRAELSGCKVSALRRRAIAAAVSEQALEDADDADDVRAALVEIIVQAERSL